jgi:hypothetical protein
VFSHKAPNGVVDSYRCCCCCCCYYIARRSQQITVRFSLSSRSNPLIALQGSRNTQVPRLLHVPGSLAVAVAVVVVVVVVVVCCLLLLLFSALSTNKQVSIVVKFA